MRISDCSSDVCSSDLATDHRAVVDFCLRHSIGLVVIGPEAPLVDGLADNLRVKGYPVFGPGKKAAQLEGSKGFTKDLCKRANIPTAAYERVASKDGAIAALDDFALPVVIKADGLAAGKSSEEHTSELQSLMRISYAVFCLKKKIPI